MNYWGRKETITKVGVTTAVLLLLAVSVVLLAGAVKEWKSWQVKRAEPAILADGNASPETLSITAMSVAGTSVSATSPVSRLTEAQYQSIYAAEGGTKAYGKIATGNRKQAKNPGNISYIVCQVSGDYKTAAIYAFSKMTAVSSKIKVTASSKQYYSPSDNFNVAADYVSSGDGANANAWNYHRWDANGKIYSSGITFNTRFMGGYTLSAKKMLAMHELGHTFGLKDFYSSSLAYVNDLTIMKYDYRSGMTVFTDYQRFDKESLRAVYGN